jgi:hypothetical protein
MIHVFELDESLIGSGEKMCVTSNFDLEDEVKQGRQSAVERILLYDN